MLTFKDRDNDTNPLGYSVRIEEIKEKAVKPVDEARLDPEAGVWDHA